MSHSSSYIFTLLMVSFAKKGPQYSLIYQIFHYGYHFCIMLKKSLNIAIKYCVPFINFLYFFHTLCLWSIWILYTVWNGNPNFFSYISIQLTNHDLLKRWFFLYYKAISPLSYSYYTIHWSTWLSLNQLQVVVINRALS